MRASTTTASSSRPTARSRAARVIDYVTVVNAGDSDFKVGDHIEKQRDREDQRRAEGDAQEAGRLIEPFSFYLSAWEEDRHVDRAGQRGTRRQGTHRRRTGQRPQGRQLRAGEPRRSRLRRRQPEAAGLGGRLAGSVPRARRRQPRADGREHATPVGAAASRAGSDRRHRHGRRHGARFGRGRSGPPQRHHRFGRLRAHHRARRRRASSRRSCRAKWAATSTSSPSSSARTRTPASTRSRWSRRASAS